MTRESKQQHWQAIKERARGCRNCPLWKVGTQTVFGAGRLSAKIMLVGEQPGDKEDITGEPFVGPAGQLLSRALQEAGIERDELYITNAVKHFKYELRGKRRMHKAPAQREIEACRGWLMEEIELIGPRILVALGATAARALLGRAVPVLANRAKTLSMDEGHTVFITVHPSSLLRMPDESRQQGFAALVNDLRQLKNLID